MDLVKFREVEYICKQLTLDLFDKIKIGWPKELPIGDLTWWDKKSDFGVYFLNCITGENFIELNIEDWEWPAFDELFHTYFITDVDYERIKNNILFLHGKISKVHEDAWFITYTLIRKQGFNWGDLKNMSYKGYMIFYYYSILDNISDNAEAFASLIKPKETKNGERIYR